MTITKRKGKQPVGPLHRRLTVTSWDTHFSVGVVSEKRDPERWVSTSLTVRGDLNTPVRDAAKCEVTILQGATTSLTIHKPPGIGSVRRTKPFLDVLMALSPAEFASVLAFACSGRLAYCSLSLMPPRYGSGPLTWISFDTAPAEPDEEWSDLDARQLRDPQTEKVDKVTNMQRMPG